MKTFGVFVLATAIVPCSLLGQNSPSAASLPATAITPSSMKLNGTVVPKGAATTAAYIEWGPFETGFTDRTGITNLSRGNSSIPVSGSIANLLEGHQYMYRTVASNSSGVAYSGVVVAATAHFPRAITMGASAITPSAATVQFALSPWENDSIAYVEFGATTNFGMTTASVVAPAGVYTNNYAVSAGGLQPGILYYFRAVASNVFGVTYGDTLSLTTALYPTAATEGATNITPRTATLRGVISANGQPSSAYFQMGLTTDYTIATTTNLISADQTNLTLTFDVGDLTPATTYHYRTIIQNVFGTSFGDDVVFATRDLQTVQTLAATSVSAIGATLQGSVAPNGNDGVVFFEWGSDTNYSNLSALMTFSGSSAELPLSTVLSNLSAQTTYHYRVVATNEYGIALGDDMTFVTEAYPITSVQSATNLGSDHATLRGAVTANGHDTTVYFEWGAGAILSNRCDVILVSADAVDYPISSTISNLAPGTTYNFRIVATNSNGSAISSLSNFTTLMPPVAVTQSATNFVNRSALLRGTASVNEVESIGYFEWGTTTNYENQTVPQTVTANTGPFVSDTITGLLSAVTYHFRFVVTNAAGVSFGQDRTFNAGPTVTTLPAFAITANRAAVTASVVTNGMLTWTWFEYGPDTNYGSVSRMTNTAAPTVTLTNLIYSTEYHYRAVSSNAFAVEAGADMQFMTTNWPTVTTPTISIQPGGVAVFTGTVIANGNPASVIFYWGTGTSQTLTLSNVTASQNVPAGTNLVTITATVSNQIVGRYIQCEILASSQGWSSGAYSSVRQILDVPVFVSTSATKFTNTSAFLVATVSNYAAGSLFFEWGTTTNYGSVTPTQGLLTNGLANYSNIVSGLIEGTTYHFRAVASNSMGIAYSTNKSFVAHIDPIVATTGATSIGLTTATLNGSIDPNGYPAGIYMQYGTASTNLNLSTPITNVGTAITNLSVGITGLIAGCTNYYRAVATNEYGNVFGAISSFVTVSPFTNSTITINRAPFTLTRGGAAVADFDNDGRLDFVFTGMSNGFSATTAILLNAGNRTFTNLPTTPKLPGLFDSSVACADVNNDGRIDIVLSGRQNSNLDSALTRIYRNDGNGVFSEVTAGLTAVFGGSVSCVDFNNDGRIDVFVSGSTNGAYTNALAILYRNDGNGTFTPLTPFPDFIGRAAWEDYDNDTYPDVIICGTNRIGGTNVCTLFRNAGDGTFSVVTNFSANFSAVSWGDYDWDGRADLLIGSLRLPQATLQAVLRNTGTGFTNVTTFPQQAMTSGWGDYDLDGMPDLYVSGTNSATGQNYGLSTYHNLSGTGAFLGIKSGIPSTSMQSVIPADMDGDGRLDLLSIPNIGTNGGGTEISYNLLSGTNASPRAPTGLSTLITNNEVRFAWGEYGLDNGKPDPALTYNLRVGTTPGGVDIVSPLSRTNGVRQVSAPGNLGHARSFALKSMPASGTFYWAVQSVDGGFTGSPFSSERQFVIAGPPTIRVGGSGKTNVQFTSATLLGSVDANGFSTTVLLQWGTTASYGNVVTITAVNSNAAFASVQTTLSQLQSGKQYHWRMVATNVAGSAATADQQFTTPVAPTFASYSVTNVTETSAELRTTINPNNSSGSVYFSYGVSPSISSLAFGPSISGTSNIAVSVVITNLSPSTLYYYRTTFNSTNGVVQTPQLTFRTESPLTFTSVASPTNGPFTLHFSGHNGVTYSIYSSSNLIQWDLIGQATVTNSTCDFIDSEWTNAPNRFYRIVGP